ncbi:LOW QUALITY PROTEIN: hypothetical protein PoB_005836100 [Plakobranchus ocellatus]|uniref:Uncharacterized protein n=1 Tax=Plakobranchus ocellatus TaxID=259542 RepID=A0AAV4C963_9GAST|nr:LOW QUALITY PROTEIN: hypothetical protein PoB_005836100 [Plakobranchus ocellatus]
MMEQDVNLDVKPDVQSLPVKVETTSLYSETNHDNSYPLSTEQKPDIKLLTLTEESSACSVASTSGPDVCASVSTLALDLNPYWGNQEWRKQQSIDDGTTARRNGLEEYSAEMQQSIEHVKPEPDSQARSKLRATVGEYSRNEENQDEEVGTTSPKSTETQQSVGHVMLEQDLQALSDGIIALIASFEEYCRNEENQDEELETPSAKSTEMQQGMEHVKLEPESQALSDGTTALKNGLGEFSARSTEMQQSMVHVKLEPDSQAHSDGTAAPRGLDEEMEITSAKNTEMQQGMVCVKLEPDSQAWSDSTTALRSRVMESSAKSTEMQQSMVCVKPEPDSQAWSDGTTALRPRVMESSAKSTEMQQSMVCVKLEPDSQAWSDGTTALRPRVLESSAKSTEMQQKPDSQAWSDGTTALRSRVMESSAKSTEMQQSMVCVKPEPDSQAWSDGTTELRATLGEYSTNEENQDEEMGTTPANSTEMQQDMGHVMFEQDLQALSDGIIALIASFDDYCRNEEKKDEQLETPSAKSTEIQQSMEHVKLEPDSQAGSDVTTALRPRVMESSANSAEMQQ